MEAAFQTLTKIANERFAAYLRLLPGPTPPHRVVFSRRMTTSWALIYYRRHVVRLSPYLFLLERDELRHDTHWKELDATLRHEAVHASLFATTGQTGHAEPFGSMLAALGVRANGTCDLGPENVAWRYRYACPSCGFDWPRRTPLRGNWSCGQCSPGRYDPSYRMHLAVRHSPWSLLLERRDLVHAAVAEAAASAFPAPPAAAFKEVGRLAEACADSSSLATRPPALQVSASKTSAARAGGSTSSSGRSRRRSS